MPIPKPTPEQSKEEFLSSCMGNSVMVSDFPEEPQRYAVCLAQWEENREGKAHPTV